ncbi:PAQR family membrane homeostasis protein TrhA [Candidatus Lokiarchaeum ossiferum]|uniref:PAQR family membrane homeostasis protein TrhA n=1 Tax=Candidatus Lokiarchaeum ossiferum TaxID=2951803 RepID=UPI00352E4714
MGRPIDFDNNTQIRNKSTDSKFQISKNPEERFNTVSHLLAAVLSFFGCLLLLYKSRSDLQLFLIYCVYGLSNTLLFISSSICHSQKVEDDIKTFWRTIDQIAIFIMIAGTYTPIAYIYLTGVWKMGILLAQWTFTLVGILVKIFLPDTPRWITAIIYLIQGWMIVLVINPLYRVINLFPFIMIFIGGIMYTIGVLFYTTKKQILFPGKFGAHEIWHIFVILGAASFYYVVFQSV